MARYFKQTTRHSAISTLDIGLMMCIPGINNLDTLLYISKSMFGTYKSFKLGALCTANGIPSPKCAGHIHIFSERWYRETNYNALAMMSYNIGDCTANLGLCEKLDLINMQGDMHSSGHGVIGNPNASRVVSLFIQVLTLHLML